MITLRFATVPVLSAALIVAGCSSTKVTDFQSCVSAGHPVMESHPRQCRAPDGQIYVEEVAENAGIQLTAPEANAEVSSPLLIEGQASGTWFFEGSLPIMLVDANGQLLLQNSLQADGDWMTTDMVPFSDRFMVSVPEKTSATLIIQKSNPSGLPANGAEIHVPIVLLPDTAASSAPGIPRAGKGEMCGGIAGIQCADGLECTGMAAYPDASGTCE